ncbi:QueT transporter family protein [Clostridium sp. WLY-B-L2]|uniref:QueT transporter family protein n=1 Tax=Clostridium aromativorans TaxID=2836848 RepID=A0ABS8NC42_9CLOT|nr:QueT transporter family protein [Clostridium aromativorans]MCC9296283.1 QueT transporter family protein [Clostridium aromativorans]
MSRTGKLVKLAVVAAIYIVVTIALGQLSYWGPIGFRISEVLNFLAFIDPFYIISLTLGCAISNFYSFSIVDVFVGSFATFVATYAMWKTKNMAVSIIWPVLGSAAIAEELHVLYKVPFFYTFFTQAVGELAVMILGYFLFKKIFKNSAFLDRIKIKLDNKKLESIKLQNIKKG